MLGYDKTRVAGRCSSLPINMDRIQRKRNAPLGWNCVITFTISAASPSTSLMWLFNPVACGLVHPNTNDRLVHSKLAHYHPAGLGHSISNTLGESTVLGIPLHCSLTYLPRCLTLHYVLSHTILLNLSFRLFHCPRANPRTLFTKLSRHPCRMEELRPI